MAWNKGDVGKLNQQLIRQSVISIQENKSTPRIWLEGLYLKKAGFIQGCSMRVTFTKEGLRITVDDSGSRIVSSKKKVPVIDIQNKKLSDIFKVSEKANVFVRFRQILVTKAKQQLRKAKQISDGSCGSVFSGGGLLDQAAKNAGFKSVWGIEINGKYADVWQQNHEGTMHNCDIADVEFRNLRQVELLVGGIPCEPFSRARRNENRCPDEMHENADLSIFFLMVVEAVNPKSIVLEEVPGYLKSSIGITTIAALKRMGYNVSTKIISGQDFGEFEIRKRAVIVATTDDKFEFPIGIKKDRKMKEILLKHSDPKCEWFDKTSKPHVFNGWKRSKANGNYFNSQIITENSTYVQAITKRYLAQQSGNPIVKHQKKAGVFRWLTLEEIQKLMTLKQNYKLGNAKIVAGEVLGQGVIVKVFQKIIESLSGVA